MISPDRSATGDPSRPAGRLAQEKAYVRTIERRFVALRGSGLYLSPRDFALLLDWHARGVPADLVIATIENLLAKTVVRSRARTVQSIAYCRRAVEEAWEDRRAALLGPPGAAPDRGSPFTPAEIADHLARAAAGTLASAAALETLDGPAAMSVRAIAARLEALAGAPAGTPHNDLPGLEEELVRLETDAIAAIAAGLGEAQIAVFRRDAEQALEGFTGRMSARAREATIRRSLEGALRRRMRLPRYSLFTMSSRAPLGSTETDTLPEELP